MKVQIDEPPRYVLNDQRPAYFRAEASKLGIRFRSFERIGITPPTWGEVLSCIEGEFRCFTDTLTMKFTIEQT